MPGPVPSTVSYIAPRLRTDDEIRELARKAITERYPDRRADEALFTQYADELAEIVRCFTWARNRRAKRLA